VGWYWAAGPESLGPVMVEMKEKQSGLSKDLGRIVNRLQKNAFPIYSRFLDSKQKFSNNFKLNLNWSQIRIDLIKLFEYFSNLKLFKISLNIQIETNALNGGLLK
jgi:hypothetical protein